MKTTTSLLTVLLAVPKVFDPAPTLKEISDKTLAKAIALAIELCRNINNLGHELEFSFT